MPLPFILAGVAIAAAGYGAKKGIDGYQDKSEAEDITKRAQNEYDEEKRKFDSANEESQENLAQLGRLQLQVGENFAQFKTLADELLEKLNKATSGKDFSVNIPQHKLDKIADLSFSATTYLGQLAGATGVGAAAAYAVYGGVMALAAASTGTPIAALSGAAAYNATMAAIGGGSIAAGGFGMAGGAMVLGGVVAAPILAIAGWAYASHAEEALENARKFRREVDEAIPKIILGKTQLMKVSNYVENIYLETNKIYQVFNGYFNDLKTIDIYLRNGGDIGKFESTLITTIDNGYSVAAILTDIITTPLFKPKKDEFDEIILNEDNAVEIETDENGMQILNENEINTALLISKNEIKKYND